MAFYLCNSFPGREKWIEKAWRDENRHALFLQLGERNDAKEMKDSLQHLAHQAGKEEKLMLALGKCRENMLLACQSCDKKYRALEVLGAILPANGMPRGDECYAESAVPIAFLRALREEENRTDDAEYFLSKLEYYLETVKEIYAAQFGVQEKEWIQRLPIYYKKKIPWAYVRTTDIVSPGTKIRVRSLENDAGICICADSDVYIMIGCMGEVYDIQRKKFEASYESSKECLDIFERELDFLPVVEIVDDSGRPQQTVAIDEVAHLCYPKPGSGIYAMELSHKTKVFASGSEDYFIGEVGDYLAIRPDDLTDVYIIQKNIFFRTYTQAAGDSEKGDESFMQFEQAKQKLAKIGQEHILRYYEQLGEEQKTSLLSQIEQTDFSVVDALGEKQADKKGVITPLKAMTLSEIEEKKEEYQQIGTQAIRANKVAAVLLAGGMGTRLGSDAPKGVYNIGKTRELYIFECLINNLMDVVKMTGSYIYLFVMTSDKNHEPTTAFFREHDYFGYPQEYVRFFQQEMAPAVDYQGKVYLEEKGKIATSPNGNGGWFVSMNRAGITDFIHEKGIKWLNVFAVDNVLQKIADPVFVGACEQAKCSVGAKVVRKADPHEKVGVVCLEDGKPSIVEYYELTEEMANQRDENGEYAYNFGVILNYLFDVKALEEIMARKLPLHTVEKKIPYVDEDGNTVKPDEPNGYKFEQLVLDMIHEMDSCLPYEVIREKEFAPIKNKEGIDSVESARALLEKNGVVL